MRALALLLAFMFPIGILGCAESAQEEAFEEGAPPGDMEDVIGDGEIIDEPAEPEGNVFQTWDADGDGMVNETEFGASGETDMTVYDTDGDGMISQAEYDAYMAANP
jgi:hypothetical protein